MLADSLPIRATCAAAKPRFEDRVYLRVLLRAQNLLALALGQALGALRLSDDPLSRRFGQHKELEYQLPLAFAAARILGERWAKVPDRNRPFYTPSQRFQILQIRAALVLTAKETAALFAISTSAIYEWEATLREARKLDPAVHAVGERVKPEPPVRRYADVVRHLVLFLGQAGVPGPKKIAETMARLGVKISPRTAGRALKERSVPPDTRASVDAAPDQAVTAAGSGAGAGASGTAGHAPRRVEAKAPLDKVHIDITNVKGLFGLVIFRIAVVLDVFSRYPLAFGVYLTEPSAADMVRLLERAVAFGKPGILITDKGSVFTSGLLHRACATLGIEQRFGALYQHGSIARLERFWRTLKSSLFYNAFFRRLVKQDLERDLQLALTHYTFFRPHSGLGGATPAEIFLRLPPAHLTATPPPRGKPGEVVPFPRFEVEHIGPGLPVFRRKAA